MLFIVGNMNRYFVSVLVALVARILDPQLAHMDIVALLVLERNMHHFVCVGALAI